MHSPLFGMVGSKEMNATRGLVLEVGDPRIPQLLREAGAIVMGSAGDNGHVCRRETCAPQPVCVGYNLYVCAAGMLHVCSQQSCKLWQWDVQTQSCPISGIQHGTVTSDYVRDDPRTWGGGTPRKSQQQHQQQQDADYFQNRASALVKVLLYSNARKKCNDMTLAENIARGQEMRTLYDANQRTNEQPSYWTDRYRILGRWSTEPLPFKIYVFDQVLHDYYVRIIMQVWAKVERYYSPAAAAAVLVGDEAHGPLPLRADIDCIAVSVLYYMRNGLKYQNVRLLPKDDFLVLNLPHANQLHYFKIPKSNITHGEKIIERTFEMACARGVPDHELALAPEQMVAVPVQQQQQQHQQEGVILDSNGDQLFRLSSDKNKRHKKKQ
jgi:hypothetical protein